jgi:diadenosine tetraphosphatase ApaH/serine/threonine PP2A family protein phosphatase
MRYALIADIHANLPALQGVLDDIRTRWSAIPIYHGAKAGDVIAFGHTHKPWRRVVTDIHFVNAGSVGRPKDGDWRACYVVVDTAGTPVVETVRVAYDVDAAMAGIRSAGLPGDFAEHLRTGGRA